MNQSKPISVTDALEALTFLADRTPHTSDEAAEDAFASLAVCRDGEIFIGHYAGNSEWERHPGDEVVMVIEGETTLILLEAGEETPNRLGSHELLVVPAGTWHRFETLEGVKILSVTPQPTNHSIERPES